MGRYFPNNPVFPYRDRFFPEREDGVLFRIHPFVKLLISSGSPEAGFSVSSKAVMNRDAADLRLTNWGE
jgi:hypothetical protein